VTHWVLERPTLFAVMQRCLFDESSYNANPAKLTIAETLEAVDRSPRPPSAERWYLLYRFESRFTAPDWLVRLRGFNLVGERSSSTCYPKMPQWGCIAGLYCLTFRFRITSHNALSIRRRGLPLTCASRVAPKYLNVNPNLSAMEAGRETLSGAFKWS